MTFSHSIHIIFINLLIIWYLLSSSSIFILNIFFKKEKILKKITLLHKIF